MADRIEFMTDRAVLAAERDAFLHAFRLRPAKWSAYNLARLLNRTGEPPDRVEEARAILFWLGMDGCGSRHWATRRRSHRLRRARRTASRPPISQDGVWDHGEMFSRDGIPTVIVGHPYHISNEQRGLLEALAEWSPRLHVAVDDRPSYYGFGTHHVRVELVG